MEKEIQKVLLDSFRLQKVSDEMINVDMTYCDENYD